MKRGNGCVVGGIEPASYRRRRPLAQRRRAGCRGLPRRRPPPPPAATRPSEGWISSQPWPEKESWIVSPEPLPMNVFRLTSVFTELVTPSDQVIAACGSAKVSVAVELDHHRRSVGDQRDRPGAGELHVVEAAGERPGGALDPLDVPVDPGLEGEHVRAVDGDLLAGELAAAGSPARCRRGRPRRCR